MKESGGVAQVNGGEEAVNSQQARGQAATDQSHLLLHITLAVLSGASRGLGYTKGGLSRG